MNSLELKVLFSVFNFQMLCDCSVTISFRGKTEISIQEMQNKKLENAKLKQHIANLNEKRAEAKRRHTKMFDQETYLH
jgi:hypothetical protein